jgi:hypothetical protein
MQQDQQSRTSGVGCWRSVHAAQLLVDFQQRGKSVLLGFSHAIRGMSSKENRNSRTVKEK